MSLFLLIVFSLPLLNLFWWRWADRSLRRFGRAARVLLAAFVLLHMVGYFALLFARAYQPTLPTPQVLLATVYIWHLIVLPLASVLVLKFEVLRTAFWLLRGRARSSQVPGVPATPTGSAVLPEPAAAGVGYSRRELLALAAVALPPLVNVTGVARAASQLEQFRLRRIDLPISRLPSDLAGLTIAHISDLHVGRFTREPTLAALVERVNALRPDLVAITGDTIDFALADLPAALDMIRRLDPRHGVFMCEGNHDLFEGRAEFERRVTAAGVPLLLNDSRTLTIRGAPLQLLGLKWGAPGQRRDPLISQHFAEMLTQRDPQAFGILLAHHPHAFDAAAAGGIPLTLAGHTHGGQLMLTPDFGAGPALFKYWSGLYRRNDAALVVSNGVGNWFPLRVNAPAELVLITLRRA